ncbi:MAG: Por secretion system C-terminal sorting protein [Bacteroidota bacterium]|nr:Por secretion system C-terminal sorting protein [Bacteroidota bacterium]
MRLVLICTLISAFVLKSFSQLSEGGIPPGFKFADARRLNVISMPAINVDSMLADDAVNDMYKERPYRFGYNHLVNFGLNNSGTWTTLSNGNRIWQLDIKAAGAFTLNFAFSHLKLPVGAKLFVYSKDGSQVLGAFTSKNNYADGLFGTELINGDEAVIEYFEPVEARGQGSLILFRITQGYKDVNHYVKSFGDAGACMNNINCPQYSAWATQKRAVVCLVSGGNEFCSGSLVNNTANDGTPYILTANHCGTADNTWIFRFNWEAPGCSNPSTNPSSQSITGATEVANNQISDFNLVRMSQVPPSNFNVFYAGWDHSGIPATSVTGIHHPSGDIKKCSQANNAVTASTYNGGYTAQVWQIGLWTDGVTEPGSSGSPLFDQNQRVVGQLFGGPSFCGATGNQLSDNYGRFSVSWDTGSTAATRLHDWLDPGNTGTLTNDGYDPSIGTLALDASLTGVIAPTGSSCNVSVSPVITIRNAGKDSLVSATITYHLNNNADATFNWSGLLTTGQSANVSLPTLTATGGSNTFYASVSLPDGGTDLNTANDSINGIFTVIVPSPVSTPFTEGFEGAFTPTGWTLTTPSSGTTWTQNTTGAYGTSGHSVSVDEWSPFSSNAGEVADLVTPFIDLSGGGSPATLSFDIAYARYDNRHSDTLAVLVSTDCGTNWTSIYHKGGSAIATAPDTTKLFVPRSTQWRRDTIDISSYIGQAAVKFDFQMISGYGNVLYLDNVNVSMGPFSGLLNQTADGLTMRIFPNPFNETLMLEFELSETQNAEANLYSVDGKLVKEIISGTRMPAGRQQLSINTNGLSSGLYLLKLNNSYLKVEKMK